MISSYHYDERIEDTELRNFLDPIFFGAFTIEIVLKFVGLGRKKFMKDNYNIFDALVVLI